jgi:hypothetical protein
MEASAGVLFQEPRNRTGLPQGLQQLNLRIAEIDKDRIHAMLRLRLKGYTLL